MVQIACLSASCPLMALSQKPASVVTACKAPTILELTHSLLLALQLALVSCPASTSLRQTWTPRPVWTWTQPRPEKLCGDSNA